VTVLDDVSLHDTHNRATLRWPVSFSLTHLLFCNSRFYWIKVLHPTRHKIRHFGDILPSQSLGIVLMKLKLTQQKHRFTTQKKCTTTHNKHKKLKPGLVDSYDILPGNREGLFWFWRFINLRLTYLLRHLPTYLQPRDPHGATHDITHHHSDAVMVDNS